MKRLARYALIVLVAVAFAACDSTTDDERSDQELFVGQWTLLQVEDAEGDKTALMQQAGTFEIDFDDDEFVLTFDPVEGEAQVLDNTYAVNESTSRLTLNAAVPGGGTQQIVLGYAFGADGDTVELTMPTSYVQLVVAAGLLPPFGAFEGDVRLTLQRA